MGKRILSLVLILALLPCCLAVPVLADEVESRPWYELLDYSDAATLVEYAPESFISFNLPESGKVFGIDVIVTFNSGIVPDAAYVTIGSTKYELTMYQISGYTYRLLGSCNRSSSTIKFSFDVSDTQNVKFSSIKICAAAISATRINAIVSGSSEVEGLFVQKHFTSSSGSIHQEFTLESNQILDYSGFNVVLHFAEDWQAYDYIDVSLGFGYGHISSIHAALDGVAIPCEVSYILDGTGANKYMFFTVRLDLRSIDRLSSMQPYLRIVGNGNEGENTFTVYDCMGIVTIEDPSLWSFWFTNVQTWLSSGFSSVASGLTDLGSAIGTYISTQTTSFVDALVDHQNALIANEQAQHEANQAMMNMLGDYLINIRKAVVAQGESVVSSLSTNFTNLSTWITSQTTALTTSISSWGQSLKDSIDALPDKIAEALKALMVPEDGAVQSMAEKSEDLVADRFGGVYEGAQIVDNWASQLQAQAATQILTVPVVEMNILGKIFPIGGWEVDLVPDGFEIIFESVKIIIDILATLAFVNGIKSRLERTLEG